MKKAALCIFVMICSISPPALAFEFGANLPVNSKYMWRGIELNKEAVFQPDIWARYKGFTFTVWGNLELTDVHNGHRENGETGDFTEINYIVSYDASFNKFRYGVGYIYYDYPHTEYDWTHELFLSLGYDAFLSPTFTFYRDLRLSDGWYTTASLNHDISLTWLLKSTLKTCARVGFSSSNHSDTYYGIDKNLFSDVLVSAALEIPVTAHIAITPAVNYSAFLDNAVRNKRLNKRNDTFWFGINLSFSFEL